MASKKGLSEAEKRTKMSEIFLSGDVYTFKEIEKIATQQKKIVLQSVKEVLQSLVDDNLVCSDKIGTSMYYWSFPSDAKRSRKAKIESLSQELLTMQIRKQELERMIESNSVCRQTGDERTTLIQTLQHAEETKLARENDLIKYSASDPRIIEEKERQVQLYREAASQAAENIWTLQTYFTREMHFTREDVNAQFDIDEDALEDTW